MVQFEHGLFAVQVGEVSIELLKQVRFGVVRVALLHCFNHVLSDVLVLYCVNDIYGIITRHRVQKQILEVEADLVHWHIGHPHNVRLGVFAQ